MSKYEYVKLQTGKIVGAYGGIGSIIETRKGAFKVEDFDQWPFFSTNSYKDGYEIEDPRLTKRLRFHFTNLKQLFHVPPNTADHQNKSKPAERKHVISATYFPKWMYCPRCKRFKPLDKWWENWKITLGKHNQKVDEAFFIKPKCYRCYKSAFEKKSKSGKRKKLYYELEQVRFIMTSPQGDIRDIPWERWPSAQRNVPNDDGSGTFPIKLDFENLCCDNQDLRYIQGTRYADLAGVIIECKNCKKRNSLAGLFRLRCIENGNLCKPVIRSSNSVFYPLTVNSIYLPVEPGIDRDTQATIKTLISLGKSEDSICEILKEKNTEKQIRDFIRSYSSESEEFEPEIAYRRKEFDFITGTDLPIDSDNTDFRADPQDVSLLERYGIQHLIKLKRLKMITVQTAYTRQEPMDRDTFLQNLEKEEVRQIQFKYTSRFGKNTEYLPAVESFGEGIFINFDPGKVEDWFNEHYEKNSEFKTRIDRILNNISGDHFFNLSRFMGPREKHLSRFVLVHTFSHILIKELEFLAGYSAASLSERLFVDENEMQGLLICTIAGAEGSCGGLISQGEPEKFKKIIESAIHRALDCASDPVCRMSEEQGVGGLNLAACYSCTLLPETSCEEFNSFLDRRILIDEEFGFFKDSSQGGSY